MSYQPQPPQDAVPTPPGMAPPTVQPVLPPPGAPQYGGTPAPYPPVAAPANPAKPAKGGRGLTVSGIIVLAAGVVVGVALIGLGAANEEATVEKFARAPVGCTTTLEFADTGTFTLYVESEGRVGDVAGDCATEGALYSRSADDPPQVTLTLTSAEGTALALRDVNGPSYSTGDYTGEAHSAVTITETGSYSLSVVSNDSDFAIAVGRDPQGDANALLASGVAVAVVGVVLGVVLLLLGRSRRRPLPPAAPTYFGQWPQQPTVPGYQPQVAVGHPPLPAPPPPPPSAPPGQPPTVPWQ